MGRKNRTQEGSHEPSGPKEDAPDADVATAEIDPTQEGSHEPSGDEEDLDAELGRLPGDTPGHEPEPVGREPIVMAKAERAHHVLCRVVGPGGVRYEGKEYPEGSVAEFTELDARSMPQLERV
jgi:hypothetical protein